MDFVGISSNNFWNFDENVAEMTVFQYISSRECHFGSTLKRPAPRSAAPVGRYAFPRTRGCPSHGRPPPGGTRSAQPGCSPVPRVGGWPRGASRAVYACPSSYSPHGLALMDAQAAVCRATPRTHAGHAAAPAHYGPRPSSSTRPQVPGSVLSKRGLGQVFAGGRVS